MPLSSFPEELLLHIFTYIQPSDLWLSTRLASKSFNRIISSHLQTAILPHFKISISYNLGEQRWYDVRTRVFLSYISISKSKSHQALFGNFEVHPEPYTNRAIEKWERLAIQGFNPELTTEWTVQLRIGNPRLCDMHQISLRKTYLTEEGALCNWRELLTGYFHEVAKSSGGVDEGVSELTTPAALHAAAISYVRGTG